MSDTIFVISYAELSISRSCTLACDGCAVFANYGLKRLVSLEEGGGWLRTWARRIKPKTFRLLGGEPLMNKDLFGFIRLVSELWPEAERGVVTNGTLLDRVPELPEVLTATGTRLYISLHSNEAEYIETLRKSIRVLHDWIGRYGGDWLSVSDNREFHRFYKGLGPDMKPFADNDVNSSWLNCVARVCVNIYDDRLWKCPQVLFIKDMAEKYGLGAVPEWQPYLNYQGVEAAASDQELHAFFTRGSEAVCGMCPARPQGYLKDIRNRNFNQPGVERVENDASPVDYFRLFGENGIYIHSLLPPQPPSPVFLIR